MACVPKSKGTPSSKGGKQGHISEYVPSDGPMVPGIIVRCINEVCVLFHFPVHLCLFIPQSLSAFYVPLELPEQFAAA